MTRNVRDLLLIDSTALNILIEDYRLFFISIIPAIFILCCVLEYFSEIDPIALTKRAIIAVLIMTASTSVYKSAIDLSIDSAEEKLMSLKGQNILIENVIGAYSKLDTLRNSNIDKSKRSYWIPMSGVYYFVKDNIFDAAINNTFSVTIYFLANLCFIILKVVYSLVYYLGYGLLGIPCILYMLPKMQSALKGAATSFLWCIITPHVLVFIISLISTEIEKGYTQGHIIGSSLSGSAMVFALTFFIAFTPLISAFILSGAGVSQAAGIMASIGAAKVMNLSKFIPKKSINILGSKMNQMKSSKAQSRLMSNNPANYSSRFKSSDQRQKEARSNNISLPISGHSNRTRSLRGDS